MADTKNLPTNLLPPALVGQFRRAIGTAVSLAEGARLSTLPLPAIRKEIVTLQLKLGSPVNQAECDAALELLALAGLPRASVGATDYPKVRALYLAILRDEGVTGPMLKSACEAYIKRPTNGKAKFFPDPGQLLELCADDAKDRRRWLEGLNRAISLVEGPPPSSPAEEDALSVERMAEIRRTVEKLHPARPVPDAPRRRERPAPASPSVSEILASRDPAAVERFRNFTKQKQQA